jgi:hypothetical protein
MVMAQDDVRVNAKADADPAQPAAGQVIKLSRILKSKVLIQQDQPAGIVTDVVLSDGGCVEYLVVSNEDQFYVVPYAATQVRYADQVVFLDMAPAQFQKVTYFSANSWPNLFAPAYRTQIYSFYGLGAPRANVNVNAGARNRTTVDPQADSATPTPRKTLKPELPDTPTKPDVKKPTAPEATPDVKKPKLPGDQPVQPQPKEVNPRTPNKDINPRTPDKDPNPRTPDKKPDVPPTPNPIPKDSKDLPKPKLPE